MTDARGENGEGKELIEGFIVTRRRLYTAMIYKKQVSVKWRGSRIYAFAKAAWVGKEMKEGVSANSQTG